jgi:hypothetical protein
VDGCAVDRANLAARVCPPVIRLTVSTLPASSLDDVPQGARHRKPRKSVDVLRARADTVRAEAGAEAIVPV